MRGFIILFFKGVKFGQGRREVEKNKPRVWELTWGTVK